MVVNKLFRLLAILFNFGYTSYLIITNLIAFIKYENRGDYVIERDFSSTTSPSYYIVEVGFNGTLCPKNALFTYDVTDIYNDIIINKELKQNHLFVAVYWLSTIVAVIINVADIFSSISKLIRPQEENDGYSISCVIGCVFMQFLSKGIFAIPTYFIQIFDFSQPCLLRHTKASQFLLEHTFIGILISLMGMIFWILWQCIRRCSKSDDHVGYEYDQSSSSSGKTLFWYVTVPIIIGSLVAGCFGIFVWVISLIEDVLTIKAIMIGVNFIMGVIHELLAHFKQL